MFLKCFYQKIAVLKALAAPNWVQGKDAQGNYVINAYQAAEDNLFSMFSVYHNGTTYIEDPIRDDKGDYVRVPLSDLDSVIRTIRDQVPAELKISFNFVFVPHKALLAQTPIATAQAYNERMYNAQTKRTAIIQAQCIKSDGRLAQMTGWGSSSDVEKKAKFDYENAKNIDLKNQRDQKIAAEITRLAATAR